MSQASASSESFSSQNVGVHEGAASPFHILQTEPGKPVSVPASGLIEGAEYARSGPDLILVGEDGQRYLLRDYFASDEPGMLIGANGAVIDGGLASRLAGSIAPSLLAQARGAAGSQSIGRADTMNGQIQVIHADGSKGTLNKGDPVFQGDVLQTPKGASVGLVFMDGTTLALGGNGRLVLDQMVFDPATQSGKSSFSLVQGTFSFVSGQIAKSAPDAASLKTPVATIGIRGTMVAGGYTPETGLSTTLLPETGGTGEISITNAMGTVVNNISNGAVLISNYFSPPSSVVQVNSLQVVNSYNQVLGQIANTSSGSASGSAQQILSQASSSPSDAGSGAPATVEGVLQNAGGSSANSQSGEFARAAQQAINAALIQGIPIEQALRAAMAAHQAYVQAMQNGASQQQALSAAAQAAQQSGVLNGNNFMPGNNDSPNNSQSTTSGDGVIRVTAPSVTLGQNQSGTGQQGSSNSNGDNSANGGGDGNGLLGATIHLGQEGITIGGGTIDNSVTTTTTTESVATASFQGKAVDGYISGATVFLDADGDKVLDAGETWTITDSQGNYSFSNVSGSAQIVLFGGTDISTNQALVGVLTAPAGSTVVTPLTTMMQTMISTLNLTEAQAQSKVAALLGIADAPDLADYDPVAMSGSGSASEVLKAASVMKAAVMVQNMVVQMSAMMMGASGSVTAELATQAVFAALASKANDNASLDFSSSSEVQGLIESVATNLSLDPDDGKLAAAKTAIAGVIANVNAAVDQAFDANPSGGSSLLSALANVATVAQGAAASAIQSTMELPTGQLAAALSGLSDDYDSSSLDEAISSVGNGLGGTSGNDTIAGTAANDVIHALAGNDTITGGLGDDSIDGGDGIDAASYATASGGITANMSSNSVTGAAGNDMLSGIEIVIGGDYADTMTGGSSDVSFLGGAGDDTLSGGTGNDYLDGGEGSDGANYSSKEMTVTVDLANGTASGGGGNDTLVGIENVTGTAMGDVIIGSDGANTLLGAGGADTISGGLGGDSIDGGSGDDRLYGDASSSISGDKSLANGLGGSAGFGENSLARGDDSSNALVDISSIFSGGITFFGHTYTNLGVNTNGHVTFDNTYSTYNPNSLPLSGSSVPAILAPLFNDVDTRSGSLTATSGGNSTGSNLVWYDLDATNGVITVTWDDVGYYSYGTDALNAFQLQIIYQGGSGDYDLVFRYEDINYTYGNAARSGWSAGDAVNGHYYELPESHSSNVVNLDADLGNTGVAGLWTWSFRDGVLYSSGEIGSGTNAGGDDSISGGLGCDVIYGGGGADWLDGGSDADTLFGGLGDDTILGGTGDDSLNGGEGVDTVSFASASSGVTVSLADGTASGGDGTDTLSGFEILTGSDFADKLFGSSDNDTLIGSGGSDSLFGNGGDDTLIYNGSAATIDGGLGNDTLLFSGNIGFADFVESSVDFEGLEKIDIAGTGNNTISLSSSQVGDMTEAVNGLLSGSALSGLSHALIVVGDASDQVMIDFSDWEASISPVTINGNSYSIYTANETGEHLLVSGAGVVDNGMSQTA